MITLSNSGEIEGHEIPLTSVTRTLLFQCAQTDNALQGQAQPGQMNIQGPFPADLSEQEQMAKLKLCTFTVYL